MGRPFHVISRPLHPVATTGRGEHVRAPRRMVMSSHGQLGRTWVLRTVPAFASVVRFLDSAGPGRSSGHAPSADEQRAREAHRGTVMDGSKRIRSLDGLRALSVTMVLIAHLTRYAGVATHFDLGNL